MRNGASPSRIDPIPVDVYFLHSCSPPPLSTPLPLPREKRLVSLFPFFPFGGETVGNNEGHARTRAYTALVQEVGSLGNRVFPSRVFRWSFFCGGGGRVGYACETCCDVLGIMTRSWQHLGGRFEWTIGTGFFEIFSSFPGIGVILEWKVKFCRNFEGKWKVGCTLLNRGRRSF